MSGSSRWHLQGGHSSDPADAGEGSLFRITGTELAAADDYEVDDYARTEVVLRSGVTAWVYLEAPAGEGRAG
ncbi:hypothetical protein [Streptomyces erythrochromogenes]|uniref:hypothetical protein n=1 Tax=Streptomyces erythrochromogenes TaxID=285574 RepID=UPI0036C83103